MPVPTPPPVAVAAEPVPEPLIQAAYTLIAEHTDAENPVMYALLAERYETLGTAARDMTLADVVKAIGIPLKAEAFPVDAATRRWAAQFAASQVAQVQDATRQGIAQIVADGIWRQAGPAGTGRMIRPELIANDIGRHMGMMSGLDARRISAVLKYEEGLLAKGYSVKEAERMAGTFAKRQLAKRAETIARTEMRSAVSAARDDQEVRFGAREKRWSTTGDDRVRDQCQANGAAGWIPIDDSFPSGKKHTPQGPNCRCHVQYRGMSADQLKIELSAAGMI